MGEFPKKTLSGKAAVLEGLPGHPALTAILAWTPLRWSTPSSIGAS